MLICKWLKLQGSHVSNIVCLKQCGFTTHFSGDMNHRLIEITYMSLHGQLSVEHDWLVLPPWLSLVSDPISLAIPGFYLRSSLHGALWRASLPHPWAESLSFEPWAGAWRREMRPAPKPCEAVQHVCTPAILAFSLVPGPDEPSEQNFKFLCIKKDNFIRTMSLFSHKFLSHFILFFFYPEFFWMLHKWSGSNPSLHICTLYNPCFLWQNLTIVILFLSQW